LNNDQDLLLFEIWGRGIHEITPQQSAGLFIVRKSKLPADDALSGPPAGALGCGAIAAPTIGCTSGLGITAVELRHQTDMFPGAAAFGFFVDIDHDAPPHSGICL
jgi:hypothetical protein